MRPIERLHCGQAAVNAEMGTDVGFAARRVGVLLDRLRLHLETDRFLAGRRRDPVWEVGCDYAVLALGRLASRLRASTLDAPINSPINAIAAKLTRSAVPVRGCRLVKERHVKRRSHTPPAARRGRR